MKREHSPELLRQFFADKHGWPDISREMCQIGGGLVGLEAQLDLFLNAAFRKKTPREIGVWTRLHSTLQFAGSEHAWITEPLCNLEDGCGVRTFSDDLATYSWSVPTYSKGKLVEGVPVDVALVDSVECELPVFSSITAGSNGRVESAFFRILAPITPLSRCVVESIASRFPPLSQSQGKSFPFAAYDVEARGAVVLLLSLALYGGAYSWGFGAAQGRLRTWRTLRSLVGLRPEASFSDTLARVRVCEWVFVESASSWFDKVVWDGCLMCKAPSSDIVSVVAWTDTD